MENIDQQAVDLENNDEVLDLGKEGETPDTDSRLKELEAEAAKWKRIAERNAKKADKSDKPDEETKPKEKAPGDLDYGEKAFLRSYDIKGADELALVKQWKNRTGDELDALVEDDIFQAKLKSLREAKAAADAVPKATKRATAPAKDDLQYWLEKPFADVPSNLKAGVLALRVEQERTQGQFSSNPVVFGGN